MVAILGFIKLFILKTNQLPSAKEDPQFNYLVENYLVRSTMHINNLLEGCQCILDLMKAEKDSKIKAVEFSLLKLVKETRKLFEDVNQKRDVKILDIYDAKCPEFIKSDPSRIRQILINLISNALKYTVKGEVTIEI